MARPKTDIKRDKLITVRATEDEKTALYQEASNRGLEFSEMLRVDYLQQEPTVTFATPERQQLIKAIALLGQIVAFLNGINPKDASQREQIDSAVQGAILSFHLIQKELHGHKG